MYSARTRRVVAMKAQCLEDGVGDFLLGQLSAGPGIDGCKKGRPRQQHLEKVVEVTGLQRRVLAVVREAQNLLGVWIELAILFVQVAQRGQGQHRGGRAATLARQRRQPQRVFAGGCVGRAAAKAESGSRPG